MDASEAGRALVAQRERVTFACAECGRAFDSIRNRNQTTRYCGNRCKQRAKYDRRKRSTGGAAEGAA